MFQELNDEYGNPIWKNRVESWKDKKDKKSKKTKKKDTKTITKPEERDAQVPSQQHMEDMPS